MACTPFLASVDSGYGTNSRQGSLQSDETVHKGSRQVEGGYGCVFLDDIPDHLQTECSVCLCVLREPCLVDCCGNRFCESCINAIKAKNKPCPMCNTPFTAVILDKQLKRTLNDLRVSCSNKDDGCDWIGELGGLPNHLNLDSEDEVDARLNGCPFAHLQCIHCKKLIRRQDIAKHEADQCLERPYSCDYCNDYSSTCQDVTDNHWPVCPSRSVPCPLGCGKYLVHREIENHQATSCPLAVIDCVFSYAGCDIKVARRDMQDHIQENLVNHMTLQGTHHQQQLKELREVVEELRIENQMLKDRLETQNRRPVAKKKVATADQSDTASCSTLTVKQSKALIPVQAPQSTSPVANIYPGVLIDFKDFNDHTIWWSSPFYTHPQGYKMCLKVFPNGKNTGEGTHVSVYVNVMKGEYDDQLQWPFRGAIRVRLLKSTTDGHCEQTVQFHNRVHPRVSGRVVKGDKCIQGLGVERFIRQSDLYPDYVKNDSLKLTFCVLSKYKYDKYLAYPKQP